MTAIENNKSSTSKKITRALLKEAGIGVALVILLIFFTLAHSKFMTMSNVSNILTQISINTIIAAGMTFVILLGGIDLSVGAVLALCAVVSAKILTFAAFPPFVAISLAVIASIIAGLFCGLISGAICEKWKIHSFIVTLGMLNIARGLALEIADARTIFGFPMSFNSFGAMTIFNVPVIFIIAILVVIIGGLVLSKTVFGRMIYAIGNNEESVRLSGHNPVKYKIIAFAICGGATGLAAIMYMLRLNIANPILGTGFELNAIAAVVIGGTSLFGGKGSMLGTFLGACIMGVLGNGLLLMGLGDFTRQIITGIVIILAVILDTYRGRLEKRLTD
ncbi:Ribose transport system permease protein rbsC [Phocoenobacter uteri]|uniref:Ribose transport system permease protein rbsC n=1 Tax=Phocoenobacter uteri TaxID=146806 RepID=A0A379C8Q8_9PAST|nr:ABC transporter permease [Phocoenobacter uteri]MDG6882450.1 sugar ABC transporter [Phocoenobacter uteri]SUB58611.1 Ribose transport system permease protein rbsC [Phocoenobacter uteri]